MQSKRYSSLESQLTHLKTELENDFPITLSPGQISKWLNEFSSLSNKYSDNPIINKKFVDLFNTFISHHITPRKLLRLNNQNSMLFFKALSKIDCNNVDYIQPLVDEFIQRSHEKMHSKELSHIICGFWYLLILHYEDKQFFEPVAKNFVERIISMKLTDLSSEAWIKLNFLLLYFNITPHKGLQDKIKMVLNLEQSNCIGQYSSLQESIKKCINATLEQYTQVRDSFKEEFFIEGFLVDFAFPKKKLIIEADGSCHINRFTGFKKTRDHLRDDILHKNGWHVEHIDHVLWNSCAQEQLIKDILLKHNILMIQGKETSSELGHQKYPLKKQHSPDESIFEKFNLLTQAQQDAIGESALTINNPLMPPPRKKCERPKANKTPAAIATKVIDQIQKKFNNIHSSELRHAEKIIVNMLINVDPLKFSDKLVKLFVSLLEPAVYKKSSLQNLYWTFFFQPHEYGIRLSKNDRTPNFAQDSLQAVVELYFSQNEHHPAYRQEKK